MSTKSILIYSLLINVTVIVIKTAAGLLTGMAVVLGQSNARLLVA